MATANQKRNNLANYFSGKGYTVSVDPSGPALTVYMNGVFLDHIMFKDDA